MSNTRIYFIKNESSNAVKIGVAENVAQRLSGLQTSTPDRLVLIGEMPGDERYESVLHAAFADLSIRGEWFRYEGRLAQFISLLPQMYDAEKRPRKIREKRVITGPDPRAQQYHKQVVAPAIRAAVEKIGVAKFAEIVGRKQYAIANAIYERGLYFRVEDFMTLLAISDEDTAVRLYNLFAYPLGLRARTKAQEEEDRAATARLESLRNGIIQTLGEEDARIFLEKFDRECEEINEQRMAAHKANPWDIEAALRALGPIGEAARVAALGGRP